MSLIANFEEIPPVYTITKGADASWHKESGNDVKITVERDRDNENCIKYYLGTYIDGVEAEVTAESGSVIVTIPADLLEELELDEHRVLIVFEDGEAETTITVKEAIPPEAPPTREDIDPKVYIQLVLMPAILIGAYSASKAGKKKEKI